MFMIDGELLTCQEIALGTCIDRLIRGLPAIVRCVVSLRGARAVAREKPNDWNHDTHEGRLRLSS
jgi:hypothetical protein